MAQNKDLKRWYKNDKIVDANAVVRLGNDAKLPDGLVEIDADHIDSGSATAGTVLTADGSGGASWTDATIEVDDALSDTSENPVQNKVITAALGGIVAPSIGYSQVALAAPVVTGGVNSIAWEDNPLNVGKSATVTADVDGVPVTSPLTITQAMDGKTLTITASADGYADGVTTIVLAYYDSTTKSLFAIPNPENPEKLKTLYVCIGTNQYGSYKGKINGQDIAFESDKTAIAIPVNANTTASYEISLESITTPIYNSAIVFYLFSTDTTITNPLNSTPTFISANVISGSISALRNGDVIYTTTWTSSSNPVCPLPYSASMATGDTYTFIVNITSYTLV